MEESMEHFWERLKMRLVPLLDMTAWVILALSMVPLFVMDKPAVMTIGQWVAFALPIVAISVMVARMVCPQLDLSEWLALAREGRVAAAIVVFSIIYLFVGVMQAFIAWAKT